MKEKCIVTGGAGFIGSRLVKRLFDEGHEVYVIDNLSNGKIENIDFLPEVNIWPISITSSSCDSMFEEIKPDWVFHFAALPRVQFSIQNPIESNNVNIDGTLNILECARKHNVKKFVYSSSSSAYGDQDTLPLTEDMKPNPLSPYALQKLTGEQYSVMYYNIHGLPTTGLRYFNVYGPTQGVDSAYAAAIPKFATQALNGENITIFGDGEQTRDFTFVEDVVSANIAAAQAGEDSYGKFYNVGCDSQTSVNQIVTRIKEILGSNAIIEHLPAVVESKHTRADISRTLSDLNWSPKINFDEGLEITVKGIKEKSLAVIEVKDLSGDPKCERCRKIPRKTIRTSKGILCERCFNLNLT
jgi:UDP-glucose 4-epimerase